ncbi:cadherin-like beta sandwich domain-containing protein [uncultured Draconibacterium sp.]|uniref:cadherin-like beta sandwich domain-containing protein n=1 Tax=uncultured Draconibacterium sp. TaxID=1573823 RepID=UPI0025EB89D1|nr:cadherin-like beta sandwich domain-containing protein [uncultured Draconibacterium sp.]
MMKNYMKFFLVACFLFAAGVSNAQFKFGDKSSIGQSITVDSLSGVTTFLVDFNTDKGNSTWTQDSTGLSISFSKCQTNKGIKQEVFTDASATAEKVFNGDFKVRNWGSYENPVRMASIDSMTAIFTKYGEKYAGTGDSTKNVIWKPSACLFDINDSNQVFGTHPGMYKRVEYGFYFKFESTLTSDIEFEMDTYDEGNTSQTASYKLIVAVGSEDNIVGEVADFYVSGSGKKSVKLAEAVGVDFATFSGTKVYFWLKTLGTGTEMAEDSFDPTVVFDNLTVSYQVPVWIAPPAGAIDGTVLNNMDDPFIAPADVASMDSLLIQINNRSSALEIVDDLGDRKLLEVLNLMFMDTLGLMANDGNGNYNVEVPYTYNAPVWDVNKMEWSKQKITVAAPDSMINDDMMLYFHATPTSGNLHSARLEMDCGTRIWYDYYMKGTAPYLDSLGVSAGELSPDFDPEKMTYQVVVPAGTGTLSFSATAADSTAAIELPEDLSLMDGEDYVAVVTTSSKDGSATNEYTINVHVQSENEILFVSGSSDGVYSLARLQDQKVYDALVDAGYSVTMEDKLALNVEGFDYTPFSGLVIGAGVGSSWVNNFAKDGYPVPCVTMQPDGPRANKWGWVGTASSDGSEMYVTKTYDENTVQMVVTDTTGQFITNPYDTGDTIVWTLGTSTSEDFLGKEVKSYNLSDSIPEAIPLATIPADGFMLTTLWAVPSGASVRSLTANGYERVVLANNVVFFGLFNDGLAYASDAFSSTLVRSLEWAMGTDASAELAELVPSVGELVPAFDPGKTEYQLNLPKGTGSVGLTAKATSPNATVDVPADLALSDGMSDVMTVTVTSANDSVTTMYNVMVHVQADKEILYVSNSSGAYGSADSAAINIYDALVDGGYSVTMLDKLALNSEGFDYSPYFAAVIGAGVGSSWVNNFAKDGYPIPCVTMQHDGPRKGKWGWTGTDKDDNTEMNVVKTAADTPADSAKMSILNTDHFITDIYEVGDLVEWNSGDGASEEWAGSEVKSYGLADSIPEAIALGRIPIDGSALTSWWAIPAGTSVRSLTTDGYSRVTLANNVVYLGVFANGLLYATEGFDTILLRSLAWATGSTSDATLASLVPSLGELAPSFDSGKTEYQLNLPMGTTAVSLSATATSPYAKLNVPGELALTDGTTEMMTVEVISADDTDTLMYNVMVHVQSDEEIVYISANSDGAYGGAKAFDTNVYDALVADGYSVTFEKRGALKDQTIGDSIVEFDYTPYIGMVISAGEGSSNVNNFAKHGYPIPCVTMQPDGPRVDKWGWVGTKSSDGVQMYVTKTYTPATAQMVITNNGHYITENYEMDEVVEWTAGTETSEDFLGKEVKSYNLNDSVPEAIPLATITADGNSLTTMWAIPDGTSLRTNGPDGSARVTTDNRIVLMSLFNDGLLYATAGFDSMLVRSLAWVLGAGPPTSAVELGFDREVVLYPNPAKDHATVRFTLEDMNEVSLSLYNMMGQQIEISTPQVFTNGTHEIQMRTDALNDGMYIYVLQVGTDLHKGKLNIVK